MTKRHIFVSLVSILFTLALTWIFFSQQIKTAFVYVALGMRAPMSTRWQCVQTSRQNVEKKFSVPTKFDAKTIADLKLFWHYSFYTGCLQNHGYDYYGNVFTPATLTNGVFTNPQGNFSLQVGAGEIVFANQVDVTYDDRLLLTTIRQPSGDLTVGMYKRYDPVTLTQFAKEWKHFPHREENLVSTHSGDLLIATDSAGLSGCARLIDEKPLLLYGKTTSVNLCHIISTAEGNVQKK